MRESAGGVGAVQTGGSRRGGKLRSSGSSLQFAHAFDSCLVWPVAGLQLEVDPRSMTDPFFNVSVRKGDRLDDRRIAGARESLAILRDLTAKRQGPDRERLAGTSPGQNRPVCHQPECCERPVREDLVGKVRLAVA